MHGEQADLPLMLPPPSHHYPCFSPEDDDFLTLSHSVIYFHNPKKVRADEWMFAEMESPWSGDGRGVVTQRIFSKDGTLLATCHQEVSSQPPPVRVELLLIS